MEKLIYTIYDGERIIIRGRNIYLERCFNKQKWAANILATYKDKYICEYSEKTGVTSVIDFRHQKRGIAICNFSDQFDRRIGAAIAICRAEGIKVPDEV